MEKQESRYIQDKTLYRSAVSNGYKQTIYHNDVTVMSLLMLLWCHVTSLLVLLHSFAMISTACACNLWVAILVPH